MPTVYTEENSTDAGSHSDAFNAGAPINLGVGDQLIGTLGEVRQTGADTSDEAVINVIAGLTYTFTAAGTSAASSFGLSVLGSPQTTTNSPGDFFLTTTFTAAQTGVISLGFSSDAVADYTVTLTNISYPDPTDGNDYIVGNMTSDHVNLLGGDDTYIALGGSDVVTGGLGNDFINGVCGNDLIHGNEGDDTIMGGNGRDEMYGGIDHDVIDGGNQQDMIYGEDGNDTLIGDKGDDSIDGGAGDDDISGGSQNDVLTGAAGSDIFRFRKDDGQDIITDFAVGEDTLDLVMLNVWDFAQLSIQEGGTGIQIHTGNDSFIELTGLAIGDLTAEDVILAQQPEPVMILESGDLIGTNSADSLDAGEGSDRIMAMGGDDTVNANGGNDTVLGGIGNDEIVGGSGNDRLIGDAGSDTLSGEDGNDVLHGGEGNDLINGGAANDRIYGEAGEDTLQAAHGNDKIWGGDGADIIDGGAGKDSIDGGAGNDWIVGGLGDDLMTGGAGNDRFAFDTDRTDSDTITDFTIGEDIIDLQAFGHSDINDLNMVQDGNDVLLTFTNRDSLRLEDIDLLELTADDFVL